LDVDIKERIGKKIVSIKCKDYNEMKKILEKLDLL